MALRNRYLVKDERCFFVTTTCRNWIPTIELSDFYLQLEKSLVFVSNKFNADVLGYVIMPNHLHLIVYFRQENRLSDFMRDFKKYTAVMMRKEFDKRRYVNLLGKLRTTKENRVFQIWQERFDAVDLYSRKHVEIKLEYIHMNPLQEHWNLVEQPHEYRYSSACFYDLEKQPGLRVVHYMEYF